MRSITERVVVGRANERGAALIGVLLLLMMMSALVAALGVNGQTETFIARNQMAGAQAQAAAEAGLNHAVDEAIDFIFNWKANPLGFANPESAVDSLLKGPDGMSGTALLDADNGSFATIPANTKLTISAGIDATYEAVVMDDDNMVAVGENGNLLDDLNDTLIIRATGYSRDGTKVVLEAMIAPLELGAIVTNGDLVISGSVDILGSAGDVHSNGSLEFDGSSSTVSGDASASGDLMCTNPCDNVAGTVTPNATEIPVPEVNASDYLVWADFILGDDGIMTDATGAPLCVWSSKTSCNNWNWDSGSGTWSLNSSTVPTGTYYVEGHATISGSPGSSKDPADITIIAKGNIDISGSPKLAPDTPELLFVTDMDLKIAGTIDLIGESVEVQGQMLVKGQVDIGGNASLDGQLIVEDLAVGSLVASNHIHGSVDLTYSGGLGGGTYTVTAWRDVRDAD